MLSISAFAISISRFPGSADFFGTFSFSASDKLFGEVHQLENERMLERLHSGEVLAGLDDDFRDPDLVRFCECLAEEDISLVAALLRLEVIRLVEIHRVDLLHGDKILDVDRLRRLEIDALEILFAQDDELSFRVLVAFHDLLPRHFLAVLLGNAFVVHWAQVPRPQEPKFQILPPRRRVNGDRDVNEPKADIAFPNRTHFMMKSHRGRHLRGFALAARSAERRQALSEEHGLLPVWCWVSPNTDFYSGFQGGVAVDTAGNVYVADSNNDDIRRIAPAD